MSLIATIEAWLSELTVPLMTRRSPIISHVATAWITILQLL
jgi:hypothetical protein